MERKLTALLSADVKGYSRLMGENEETTIRTLTAYRQGMATLIAQHRGRVVDSPGDNLLAEFVSAVDAVRGAVEIQRDLQNRNDKLPPEQRMEFRIGINVGDVIIEGERLYGDGVNIAARLEALAEGGGICLAGTVYDQVENKLSLRYEYLGEQAVKNITKPVRVYRIRPETETPAPAPRSAAKGLVVLPFANLSPDPDNEFFADGLTEEVIADLSGIRALRVISRTSAMHFKGTNQDLRAIARELDVRYVLEGSVRRAGSSLRVTAQLIDAGTDSHLWAGKYSGSIEDVFAIQEEISQKIVDALQVRLTEAEARVVSERPIDNPVAYDCYLRARHEMYLFTPDSLDRAQKLVDDALAVIGENALLLATKGLVCWQYVNSSVRPEELYLDEASAYVEKALEQDPQNYLGIFLRGLVAAKRGDLERALRDIRRAHDQKPGDATILAELIRHLFTAGKEQQETAQLMYEEAIRVGPLEPLNWSQLSWRHFVAGRLAEAVQAARRALDLSDISSPARTYGASALALAGHREEAVAVFEQVASALPGTPYGDMSLFFSRALQGDAEGAAAQVTPQLEQAAYWTEYLALYLADGYALIGRRDAALRWLRTAVVRGFINYPYLATYDPFLQTLHGDSEFEALMADVRRRWEAFEL